MGGAAAVCAASKRPDLVQGLVCFEPICPPAAVFDTWMRNGEHALATQAMARRATFGS